MDWTWVPKYTPLFLSGIWMTIVLLVLTAVFGFLLALPVGFAQVAGPPWLRRVVGAYCTFMRGTPLLMQLFLFYYGLGSVFAAYPEIRQSIFWPILREGFYYAAVGFILNEAAYAGEVMRGAFLSVPKGELEAARAIGMSPWKVFTRVWAPRAVRNAIPNLGTETVLIMKATPIAALVTVSELFGAALKVRSDTYIIYEPLLLVMAVYLVLTFIITRIFGYVEAQVPYRR